MSEVRLDVQSILSDLRDGLDRKAIKAKYKLTGKMMTEIFKDPRLKNKKPHGTERVVLYDSAAGESATNGGTVIEAGSEAEDHSATTEQNSTQASTTDTAAQAEPATTEGTSAAAQPTETNGVFS